MAGMTASGLPTIRLPSRSSSIPCPPDKVKATASLVGGGGVMTTGEDGEAGLGLTRDSIQ